MKISFVLDGCGASVWDDRLPPERDRSDRRGSIDEKIPGEERSGRARGDGGGSEESRKGDGMGDAWADIVITEWSNKQAVEDKGEARSGVETVVLKRRSNAPPNLLQIAKILALFTYLNNPTQL
jgi:hypothetical protein